MLSDGTIQRLISKGQLSVGPSSRYKDMPMDDRQWQPVSVDLRLGDIALPSGFFGEAQLDESFSEFGFFWIYPGKFILGSTIERVELGRNIVGTVVGKSTVARMGVLVEAAGLVDPGFQGEITLEIFNMGSFPVKLLKGMRICQITFDWVDADPLRIYGEAGNHYQGQTGPTPAARGGFLL